MATKKSRLNYNLSSLSLRWHMVWKIMMRDLLSTIRDRRTLNASILMPMLIIPLMTLGLPLMMGQLIGGQQEAKQKVGVVGQIPAGLRSALESEEKLANGTVRAGVTLLPVTDPITAVRSGDVEAVIKSASPLPTAAGKMTGTLEVYTKLNNMRSDTGAYSKVQDVVERYNRNLILTRLKSFGLGEQTLAPITLKAVDASPPQEQRSGPLAFLVPFLLLQFIVAGATATAVDATAGEKERGTLESLLVSPVRRSEVVAGKLLATTITALISACFGVVGFLLSGVLGAVLKGKQTGSAAQMTALMGGELSLNPLSLLAMLGIAASAALIISALLIAISIYARSFKEAQTYIAPLNIALIVPLLVLQFSDLLTLNAAIYAIPLMGSMLTLLELVRGNLNGSHILLSIGANLIGAALFSLLALRSFNREEVIFRN